MRQIGAVCQSNYAGGVIEIIQFEGRCGESGWKERWKGVRVESTNG